MFEDFCWMIAFVHFDLCLELLSCWKVAMMSKLQFHQRSLNIILRNSLIFWWINYVLCAEDSLYLTRQNTLKALLNLPHALRWAMGFISAYAMFFILQIYYWSIAPENLQFCYIHPHNNVKIPLWLNQVALSIFKTFLLVLLWKRSMHLGVLVRSPVPCNVYPTVWMETSVLGASISFNRSFASTWTYFPICLHKNLVAVINIFVFFVLPRLSLCFGFHFELTNNAANSFSWNIQHSWYHFVALP